MELSIARIETACRTNLDAMAESLNLCFNLAVSLEAGKALAWTDASTAMSCPGVVVEIGTPEGAVLGFIPESLPLPAWIWEPNDSQTSQLKTLAAEWSILVLPEETEASGPDARAVKDLLSALMTSKPLPESQLFEFIVPSNDGTPKMAIWLLATATASPFVGTESLQHSTAADSAPTASPKRSQQAAPTNDRCRQRLGRVLKVPVQVVVHLADKKIEMGQLLSIAPGSLIAFDKNCEDLLDLYVNNRLYCRGEAVKIGENFGLKINELGAVKQRVERVL